MDGDRAPNHEVVAQIEATFEGLRAVLADGDEAGMAMRPPNGKWSVLENVRHLLFAEEAHLGQFHAVRRPWSPLGYTPEGMLASKRMEPQDGASAPTVAAVMEEWAQVRAVTDRDLADRVEAEVQRMLVVNLRHLRQHVGTIERLVGRGVH